MGKPVIGAYTQMFGARAKELEWLKAGRQTALQDARKRLASQEMGKRKMSISVRMEAAATTQRPQTKVQDGRALARVSFTSQGSRGNLGNLKGTKEHRKASIAIQSTNAQTHLLGQSVPPFSGASSVGEVTCQAPSFLNPAPIGALGSMRQPRPPLDVLTPANDFLTEPHGAYYPTQSTNLKKGTNLPSNIHESEMMLTRTNNLAAGGIMPRSVGPKHARATSHAIP